MPPSLFDLLYELTANSARVARGVYRSPAESSSSSKSSADDRCRPARGGQTAHVRKGRGPTAIRGSWAPPAWQARPSHHIGCRNGRRPARSARERRGERARSATLGGVDVPERARGECHVYTYTRVWARDCSGLRLCRAGTFIIRILYERECMQSARSVPFCDRPIPRPGLEGPENPLRFSVVHYGR